MALLILAAAGCGSSGFDYNGKWTGNRNLNRPDLDDVIRYTAGKVDLDIHDNRFTMIQMGIPVGGEVNRQGDHLELIAKTYMNQPLSAAGGDAEKMHPPIKVTAQKDGTLLVDDPMAIDGKTVVLKRAQ